MMFRNRNIWVWSAKDLYLQHSTPAPHLSTSYTAQSHPARSRPSLLLWWRMAVLFPPPWSCLSLMWGANCCCVDDLTKLLIFLDSGFIFVTSIFQFHPPPPRRVCRIFPRTHHGWSFEGNLRPMTSCPTYRYVQTPFDHGGLLEYCKDTFTNKIVLLGRYAESCVHRVRQLIGWINIIP